MLRLVMPTLLLTLTATTALAQVPPQRYLRQVAVRTPSQSVPAQINNELPAPGGGMYSNGPYGQPNCEYPQSTCPQPSCEYSTTTTCEKKKRTTEEKVVQQGNPTQPEQQTFTRETGFYQAPPRTGSFQGATNSAGVNFGAITLPELKLQLPGLELPNFYRSRTSAHMLIDKARADFVSTGYETVRTGVVQQSAGQSNAQGANTQSNDDDKAAASSNEKTCEASQKKAEELQKKIDEYEAKLKKCEELENCLKKCLDDHQKSSSTSPTSNFNSQNVNPNQVPVPIADPARLPNMLPPVSFTPEQAAPTYAVQQSVYAEPLRASWGRTLAPAPARLPSVQ